MITVKAAPPAPGVDEKQAPKVREKAADELYLAELEAKRDRYVAEIERHRYAIDRLGGSLDTVQDAITRFRRNREQLRRGE